MNLAYLNRKKARKYVKMKLAIAVVIILMLSAYVCHINAESYCNPHNLKYKLWDCDGSTAKFNENAYHEVRRL